MKKKYKKSLMKFGDSSHIKIREDFLQYVWKFKIFKNAPIFSVAEEKISIQDSGVHNLESGPDFLNAKIKIDGQLWAGNIEMHLKSSDWYVHKHEENSNYDSVILHVVWEYDVPVFRNNGREITTLELKGLVDTKTLKSYISLFSERQSWILCEKDIDSVKPFTMKTWLTSLYFERLETKSRQIYQLLEDTSNDWEVVLFCLLVKNFGMKLNAEAFLNLAKSFEFSILRKQSNYKGGIENLLFGQAGFLREEFEDVFYLKMKKEYQYLRQKFNLTPLSKEQFSFFRLRPSSFPTIRISQLASLYEKEHNLFSKVIDISQMIFFYDLFSIKTSSYWDTHYVFGKLTKKRIKKTSKSFIDLLVINTIIPVKYAYMKQQNNFDFDALENLLQNVKPEENSIIKMFNNLNVKPKNAFETQALLQLKNEYCTQKKCLQCAIGLELIKG